MVSVGRDKILVKNTLIFGVGTSLSKIMSVLLVGLYTAYISTSDFGYYDILITTVGIIIPLVSLQITDALYRNLLDAENDGDIRKTVTCAFSIILAGFAVAAAVSAAVNIFFEIRFGWLIFPYMVTTVLFTFSQNTARGIRRNTNFAVSGILYTGVMLVSNIVLIVFVKAGVEALLYSIMIADILGCVYLESAVGIFRRLSAKAFDKAYTLNMCRYSIPLLPNSVTWLSLLLVSRYAINYYVGVDANGIFAASSKFPALLVTLFGIFGLAWQENAITEYSSEDRNEYYTRTLKFYMRLLFSLTLVLLPLTRGFVGLFIDDSYYEAWRYIPFLYIGGVFQSFAHFFGAGYLSAKKTIGAFTTTLIGVVCGIIICLALMPLIGVQAASLAQMAAYFVMLFARILHTRKLFNIKIDFPALISLTGLLCLFVFGYYLESWRVDAAMFGGAVIIFIFVNRVLIRQMLGMANGALKDWRGRH